MDISEAVLAEGARRFAVDPAALHQIGGGAAADGVVYTGQGAVGDFVLKIMPFDPANLPGYQDRLAFVDYLRTNGVSVPRSYPSTSGALVEIVTLDEGTYAVTQAEKAPGRPPDLWNPSQWNGGFFRRWGCLIGQMHALAKDYPGGDHLAHWRDEMDSFVAMCGDEAMRERWLAIGETLAALPRDRDCYGVIHNDPHAWNFLVDSGPGGDGRLTVLDFDVCRHHWFVVDLAIALFQPLWALSYDKPSDWMEAHARELYSGLMAGYREANTLDDCWLERIPLFMRYRRLLFYTVLAQEENPDDWARQAIPILRRHILDDAPLPGGIGWLGV